MKNKNLFKPYETDASRIKGSFSEVVIPKNITELKSAVSKNSRVVPRGGGTSLRGGCIPQKGDVVIDLSKLNKIENLDIQRKTVEVEAGVILIDLQNYLEGFDLEFPINPVSKRICTIGGMISTNAIGFRSYKYGRMNQLVRWIEVIDPHGKVEKKGITELSDYAGLEGITGIISRVCLNVVCRPKRTSSLVAVDDIEKVISIVKNLKQDSSVCGLELFDKIISKNIGLEEKYHLLIEYESLAGLLSGFEYEESVNLIEKSYYSVLKEGYNLIEDAKIMIDKSEDLIKKLDSLKIPFFANIGLGIIYPCFKENELKKRDDFLEAVKKTGGQVNGNFGVGLMKKEFVEANDKKILTNVKKRLDPLNKFNIGKVI